MRTVPKQETLTIEFISDLGKPDDSALAEAVVGMANTEGGLLFLGAEDSGEVTGVRGDHKDGARVMAMIADHTVPPVPVTAELISEEGKDVLRIEVPRSRAITATSDGRVLRRRLKADGTPELVPLFPHEMDGRLSGLGLLDVSARTVPGASEEDLDPLERVRLRRMIQDRGGDPTLLQLSDRELDRALCLVREENGIVCPTVTGMLLIGKKDRLQRRIPFAEAAFQVLEGTRVRVNEQTSRPLLAVLEMFEFYFRAWNLEWEHGLYREGIPEFSETAFREGLVNAFCHRDYTAPGRVRVCVDDEGLSVSSPGGFMDGVNPDNLLTAGPRGRNPALAEALKRIGLAERTGRGIDRILEGSLLYGRPLPDYSESTTTYVRLFIPRGEPDTAFADMVTEAEGRLGRKLSICEMLVLSALRDLGRAPVREISGKIHLPGEKTKTNVETLVESGLVEAGGSGRGRSYFLSAKVYQAQENTIGYVRQTDVDRIRYEELVLKLAREQNGFLTRENVCELLRISPSQAYHILKKLAEKGQLQLISRGRGSKYKLNE